MSGRFIQEMTDRARAAIKDSNGWSTLLTFTPPVEVGPPFQLGGLATVHSQNFDQEGLPIISDNSHILFSEIDVNELGYTTRINGHLNVHGWLVEFDLAIGHITAKLSEPAPDGTLGLIRVTITNHDS